MKIASSFKFIIPTILFFVAMKFFLESFGFSFLSLFFLFSVSIFSAFWITKYRFTPVILMALFTVGSVLFLLTLGKNGFQYIYIVASSLLFMTTLVGLSKFFVREENFHSKKEKARIKILDSCFNLNQTIILISIFLLSSGIYSIYIDFNVPTWIVMTLVFFSFFLSTFFLTKINFLKSKDLELHLDSTKNKTFLFYSVLSGFLMSELIWIISFLPFNHLTIGAITLSMYFLFWNVLRDYLRNKLTKKNVILNLIFFTVFTSIIIFTSKWDII